MTSEVPIKELRNYLVPIAEMCRKKMKEPGLGDVGQAWFNSKLEFLDRLFIWLHNYQQKGDLESMKQLQSDLIEDIVSADAIKRKVRQGTVEKKVMEVVNFFEGVYKEWEALPQEMKSQKPKPAIKLKTDAIKGSHFSTTIQRLKKKEQVPQDIRVRKEGDKYFLIKD